MPRLAAGKRNEIMQYFKTAPARILLLCLSALLMFAPLSLADGYDSGVSARVLKKTSVTANGSKIVFPSTDRAEVTAAMVEIAPGAETGWHSHPMPVYAYVESGSLRVSIEGGGEMSYASGDVIMEVVETLHNGRNEGDEAVKLVVFYLGSEGVPLAVRRGEAKSGQGD